MPGWGVQGGERSQPFVLSYSQLFFTCASFHNKREFNFNALSVKKKTTKKQQYQKKKQKKNRETHNTVFLSRVQN